MSQRKIQKWHAVILMLVVGSFTCSLTFALFEVFPLILLALLMTATILLLFFLVTAYYQSRFWENWHWNIGTIVGWGINGLFLLLLVSVNGTFLPSAIKALWLQQFGEVAEATVLNRERFTLNERNHSYAYYRITYSWEGVGNDAEVKEYIGETDVPIGWSEYTMPGKTITVRYLPGKPKTIRIEEDFARSPLNDVGFAFFLNLYVSIAIGLYLWTETPQFWGNLKRKLVLWDFTG